MSPCMGAPFKSMDMTHVAVTGDLVYDSTGKPGDLGVGDGGVPPTAGARSEM